MADVLYFRVRLPWLRSCQATTASVTRVLHAAKVAVDRVVAAERIGRTRCRRERCLRLIDLNLFVVMLVARHPRHCELPRAANLEGAVLGHFRTDVHALSRRRQFEVYESR